jgi:hypothetical protein
LFEFFQIIGAPFLEEAKNKDADKESLNSHSVVESRVDEIPPTLNSNSQMPQAKDMESPNSHEVVAIGLDEILLTSGLMLKCFICLQRT